jgi:hypothetical protein
MITIIICIYNNRGPDGLENGKIRIARSCSKKGGIMCVGLIGGMDRLGRNYKNEAEHYGVEIKVFTRSRTGLADRLKQVDAVVIFTGKASHRIRNEALTAARSAEIPVIMTHSCGICSLRECFGRLGLKPEKCDHCGPSATCVIESATNIFPIKTMARSKYALTREAL